MKEKEEKGDPESVRVCTWETEREKETRSEGGEWGAGVHVSVCVHACAHMLTCTHVHTITR